MSDQLLFVDKYAPKTLDDMVLDDKTRKLFDDMINANNMPSMTLIGCQGSGKTSLAKAISNEFKSTVLYIPCATDGTIDVARTRIRNFCESCSFEDTIKIVILDEIDSASSSGDSNFQKSLRTLIEEFQDTTRFILTANYNKILPAILSRCPIIDIGHDAKGMVKRVKYILDAEGIKYDGDSLKGFVKNTIRFFPDIRRILNYLQSACASGTLSVINESDNDDSSFLNELVEKCRTEKNLLDLRRFYISNKNNIEDYLTFSSKLFNHVMDNGMITNGDAVLKLSNYIYQMNVVIDKEITFFAIMTLLNKEIK